jgi:protein TonB
MHTRALERRPLGALGRIGVVAGLHVAVIYLVATGLGIAPKLEIAKDIETVFLDDQIPEPAPPPLPQPDIPFRQDVVVPTPVIDIEIPPTYDSFNPPTVDLPPRTEAIPQAPGPILTAVRQDARYPLTQPPYPPGAVRAEQEGAVELEIYVLPNGRVGDARVLRSTGFALLDQSAVDEAKRRWRLQPATRDGVPFAQWHKLRVVFELRNR